MTRGLFSFARSQLKDASNHINTHHINNILYFTLIISGTNEIILCFFNQK